MNREEARKRATELVEKMTVEEIASQLRFDAPAIDRLGIPEYNWWNEGLHGVARAGVATMFPQAIGLGATFDEELLKETGDVISTEARAKYNFQSADGDRDIYKGITLWSPNVNLFRDPRWGRGHETYGEDPYLISRLGVNFIEGLQGDGEYLKTAACAKHFAVHSGPEALRHHFNAVANMKDMWETYLPQFEACVIEGKVESVMGAYNRTNGEVCCAHSYLMEEVLRGKWGFEGHYVSDCWAVRDFHENHKVTSSPEESVKLALEKGCDVNCGCTYQKIMDAYDEGLINDELLKRAAVRLFTTRYLLGMFDKTEFDSIPFDVIECKEHLAVASRATKESLVLLKNDGILPLDKNKIKKIGVIGPNANSRASLIGNYHGTSSRYITVLEGIQDYVGDDVRVFYSEGCHLFAPKIEFLGKEYGRLS
ncbi:MAG: glycoside hydrolase family 3 C-terminal domain-containing protein, partial [Lachnospiraceae bacterium]|nr:glycoside hydrolase family 3 C-terminal domain-containing protein [Lachnospiraceae bacterium]